MGGDEFVILALNMDPASAGRLAEDLIEAIREPFRIDIHQLAISLSIGIAIYPNDGIDQDDLLTNADAAMYHAKGMGRDTYCFFQSSMNANVHRQLQLVQDMRRALENSELRLHYQPKFMAPDGPIIGVEALVRWQHPTLGLLMPDEFIPIVEKTGLVIPLGKWVLNEACRQLAAWHREHGIRWSVAVNLSAVQFGHPDLVGTVSDVLRRHGLDASYLTLEVTESTAMKNADASLAILQQLHEMGVRISIDDFGTGYSSLLYLKRLPATELKIDRGFVRDLEQDTEDAAIVSAIIALGNALKVQVVAEGVETPEQREFLTEWAAIRCRAFAGQADERGVCRIADDAGQADHRCGQGWLKAAGSGRFRSLHADADPRRSVQRRARELDDLGVARDVLPHEGVQFLRAAADRGGGLGVEQATEIRRRHGMARRVVERRHNVGRHACRAEQREPGIRFKALDRVADGRHAGKLRQRLRAGQAQRLERAGLDMRLRVERTGDHHVDLATEQVADRRRRALVGHIQDIQPGHHLHALAGHVQRRAQRADRHRVLARMRPDLFDEGGHVLSGEVLARHQHAGHPASMLMGVKSRTGSKGSLRYSEALIEKLVKVTSSVLPSGALLAT